MKNTLIMKALCITVGLMYLEILEKDTLLKVSKVFFNESLRIFLCKFVLKKIITNISSNTKFFLA